MKCRAVSWLWNWNISEINSHLEDSSVGNGTGMLEKKMELAGHKALLFSKTDFLQSQQQLSLCLSDCHPWTTPDAGLPVSLRSILWNSEVRGACVQCPAYMDYRMQPMNRAGEQTPVSQGATRTLLMEKPLASARLDRPASMSANFPSALTPASPNGDRDGLTATSVYLHPWESMQRCI